MNFYYLLASLSGVGFLVGLNVLLARGRAAAVDLATLPQRLGREIPDFRAGDSGTAGNGAALCENAVDGAIYLAVVRGDSLVTRKLAPGCRAVRTGATLAFRFADFTFPKAAMTFDDDRIAAEWEARIKRRQTS